MRAVLYARVSGDDRRSDGRNLPGQLDMCREHAAARGWRVVAELAEDDRGASGADLDLPQLARALSMARAGEYDVLVTRELDRFARSLAKQLIVEAELKAAGVTVEYVLAEYADTPEGLLQKHVRAVIAEYERSKIAERARRGRRLKVKAGSVITHGRPLYGYREAERDGRVTLEIVEEQARVVRQVYEWYAGPRRISLNEVVRRLSRRREPTPADLAGRGNGSLPTVKQQGYGQWSRATLHNMLRNEAYAGVWHYGKASSTSGPNDPDTWLAVEVPAIVPRELWEAAQRRRVSNRSHAKRNTKHDYLLRRRLTCGDCGRRMRAKSYTSNGKLYLYYRCAAADAPERFGLPCPDGRLFRAPEVDAAVWAWLSGMLLSPETLREALEAHQAAHQAESAPRRERLDAMEGLLADNRAQLARLLDLYLEGVFERDVLVERQARLEETVAGLEREHRRLQAELEAGALSDAQIDDVAAFAAELAEGLEEAGEDFEARRAIVELLDVEVELVRENEEPVAHVTCRIGRAALNIVSNTSGSAILNTEGPAVLRARLPVTSGV